MAENEAKPAVGFIGLGIMGGHMARHVLEAGYPLRVHTRTEPKARPLIERGARWCGAPGELAAASDVVITMVGYPADVEAIYLAPGGIVERARAGTILVDMTTSSPTLAQRIAASAAAKGLRALDAPVSGGEVGARDAKLAIMAGGDAAAFEAALPVLRCMGANIVLEGGPGAGQHAKLANQIIVGSTLMGVCEGLAYARRAGLDPAKVLAVVATGAARSFQLEHMAPRMLDGDYRAGFFVEHFVKDLGIAAGEAARLEAELPGMLLVRRLLEEVAASGHARDGTQALFRRYA